MRSPVSIHVNSFYSFDSFIQCKWIWIYFNGIWSFFLCFVCILSRCNVWRSKHLECFGYYVSETFQYDSIWMDAVCLIIIRNRITCICIWFAFRANLNRCVSIRFVIIGLTSKHKWNQKWYFAEQYRPHGFGKMAYLTDINNLTFIPKYSYNI